jgi:hypothetical protein
MPHHACVVSRPIRLNFVIECLLVSWGSVVEYSNASVAWWLRVLYLTSYILLQTSARSLEIVPKKTRLWNNLP